MAGGLAVYAGVILGMLGGVLGPAVRPYLPLTGVFGMVLFGTGAHRVLWSDERRAARVPQTMHALVSAVVTVAAFMALGAVMGAAIGLRARLGGEGRGEPRTYVDREYGFAVSLPGGWKTEIHDTADGRLVSVYPERAPAGAMPPGCLLAVERVAREAEYTQAQLDARVSGRVLDRDAWARIARDDGAGRFEVREARLATILGIPAQFALVERETARAPRVRQRIHLAHTPHLTWQLTCSTEIRSGQEAPGDARAFAGIVESLRLLDDVAH
jgi:hypothetical protein